MARGTLPVLLGVFAVAACTELPTITEAPADGGTSVDAGTPPTDSGMVDGSVEPPRRDAGPTPDGGLPRDCTGLGTSTPKFVELVSGPAYCDKGWTLVLKAGGTTPGSKWDFDSPCWSGACALPRLARAEDLQKDELITAAFNSVAGKEVRIQTEGAAASGGREGSFVYAQNPTTFVEAMAGGVVALPASQIPPYLPALPPAVGSGQYGLNLGAAGVAQVRIGFVAGTPPLAWSGVGGKLPCSSTTIDTPPSTGSVYAPNCATSVDQDWSVTAAVVYVYVK